MASVKSVTEYSNTPGRGGLRKKRFTVVLTDNNLVDHVFISMPKQVPESDTGAATADGMLEQLKLGELKPEDATNQWNDTQAAYDRRTLGRAMLLTDVQEFYSYLPLFQAMEARGGANANQRAAYLGVSTTNYDLMAKRFSDVQGIAFFLDDEKNQIWTELPPEFN